MTRTTTRTNLWKTMLAVVKPYVSVSRAATRPRVATRPPEPAATEDRATDPRFDKSGD